MPNFGEVYQLMAEIKLPFCIRLPNFVVIAWSSAELRRLIHFLSRYRPAATLYSISVMLDYQLSAMLGLSLILKFGIDLIYSFGDIAIFIFW